MSRTASQEWVPLEDVIPKDLFKAEVQTWATRLGVQVRELHVRPIRRQMGELLDGRVDLVQRRSAHAAAWFPSGSHCA